MRIPDLRWCVLGLLLGACAPQSKQPVRLRPGVLISMDTTSAGATSVYGADPRLTPALSALASKGVTFDLARTVAPLTLPAHSSMLTGLYPIRHTVRDNGYLPLPESARTLAEIARESGYQTAAFVSAGVLTRSFGLAQGFDTYDEPPASERATGAIADRRAKAVTDLAIAWLDRRDAQRPYFLWVHYFDPHAPYVPAPRFARLAPDHPYLGEVAAMDNGIGRLLARLAQEPDYDETTIVAVGDHGEARGANGEKTHGLLLHDATLHVPLIVRFPGNRSAGTRRGGLVSVIDVYPTLLAAMGLAIPPSIDGRDLASPPSRSGVFVEDYDGYLNYGWAPLSGWACARGLYVHGPVPRVQTADGLLRIPGPEDDWVEGARAQLERIDGSGALPRGSEESRIVPDLSAFGYAGGAGEQHEFPPPMAELDLPDPQQSLPEHERIWAALARVDQGDLEGAIRELQAVWKANPANSFAADELGDLLTRAKRPAEAIEVLEAVVAAGLERPSIRRHLSLAYLMQGDLQACKRELDRYEAICPGDPAAQAFRVKLEEEIAKSKQR